MGRLLGSIGAHISTMAIEQYQNVIVGSGEPGKHLAWTLAKQGQKTAAIERGALGGACPNVACLPSKNVIFSAKVASLLKRGSEFGITGLLTDAPLKIDMAGVFRRKAKMVDSEHDAHVNLYRTSGTELVMGEARFIEPRTIEVKLNAGGTRTMRGQRVFLDLGTRAIVPDVPGLSDARPMTHVQVLNLQSLPEHLVVLGGGYVGLEFAQAMRRFGSRVTIVHRSPQLLGHADADVAEAIMQLMKDEGIDVLLKTDLLNVSGQSGRNVKLEVQTPNGKQTIEATDILVAVGRTCNADSIDASKGGVELDSQGYIRVDDKLATTAPDVWAMGECAGSPHFTHVGYDDFRIVRDNLAGGNHSKRDRIIPYCLFTDPELANVGLDETQAKAAGISYRLAKIPIANVLRTHTTGETRGFAKALIGPDDRILGFTAFCAEASELLAAVQTAMMGKMPYTALRDGIFAHPTIAEGLTVLFAAVPQK
jgi:pyruvate/2-oxoglutarate dehydrogenase complex dihydrolipoamide dehydrogenase (E3) component